MTDTTSDALAPVADVETAQVHTFLVADVRGYTRFTQEHGDEAAARLVAKFATITREVVGAHAGSVIELRGDEALAVFASARYALRAAVDLQARFVQESEADPSLPLQVGIGVDAGEAVPLEGGYRGEALNLASRLCNLAGPGEVLASEGVVYLGRRVQGLSYMDRGLMPLKGLADSVRVIKVLREAVQEAPSGGPGADGAAAPGSESQLPIGGFLGALPPGPLVGREREWDQLTSTLHDVMQGTGRVVLLSGEPGVGKTRLAQEVALKARHWGFLVATGRSYEAEQTVPYYPFLEALVTVYHACPPDIRAEIPRRWTYLGRLLPDQIGILPVPSSEGQEDQQRLFWAVSGLLEAIAESMPVALLLDDLHWADDSSLKLLMHLARHTRASRVMLLGTYRDVEVQRQHPLEAALLDLNRDLLVDEVEIRRLDQEGTAALVAEILGEKDDLSDLVELVYRRTEGNPFFVSEMLRTLVERGDVYRKDGRWERRRISEMEVPKSIRAVVGQRLSHLDERAQEILREASVLGQEFDFDTLLSLGELGSPSAASGGRGAWTEDQVDEAVEGAKAAGLLRETEGDSYAFNHALTQQVLYAELSTRRRKRLHLAAGQALEQLPERERRKRVPELARHFLEADDARRALPYSMLAGDQAEAVFAHREARGHYETALELAEELEDRAREVEALEKLAGVLTIVADYEKALKLFERAAAIHRADGNREAEARAVAEIGHVHFMRGSAEEGITRLLPIVQAMEETREEDLPHSRGCASLWAALARLHMNTDRPPEEQHKAAEHAIDIARSVGDVNIQLGAEVTLADALWKLGKEDESLRMLEDVIPRAELAGDLYNLARALGNAAELHSRRGELDKDRWYHERALEVQERRGDRGQMASDAIGLATNAYLTGDWPRSREHLERADAIIRSLGTIRLSSWPTMARGWLSLREGDLQAASSAAEELLRQQGVPPEYDRLARRLLAEAELTAEDPHAAAAVLVPAMAGTSWKRDPGFLRTLAWVHLCLGDVAGADKLAAQAIVQTTVQNDQLDRVETLIVHGMVKTRQNRYQEAERMFREALELARPMPFPYGEGRALYELGSMLSRRGDQDRAWERLREALRIFERLGARLDMERTEQALAELPVLSR